MLGEDLFASWPFPDDKEFVLEVSFKLPTADALKPKNQTGEREERPEADQQRLTAWEEHRRHAMIEIDNEQMRREELVEQMIKPYQGVMLSGFAHSTTPHSQFAELSDSFSVRIRMSGRGFKDLIQNHPHVFELSLPDDVLLPDVLGTAAEPDYPPVELVAPGADGKAVCIVDSGIQDNHRMLHAAMDSATSDVLFRCSTNDVADYVVAGGHGTRVAGAALYGQSLPGLVGSRLLSGYRMRGC